MNLSSHEKQMKLIKEENARREYLQVMERGFNAADVFVNRHYLDNFSNAEIAALPQKDKDNIEAEKNQIKIYKIAKIVFDKHEDINDKLTSVYNALYNMSAAIAVYILGRGSYVEFFIAVRSEIAASVAGQILESTLESNFPGIKIVLKENFDEFVNDISRTQEGISMIKGLTTVSVIPYVRNKDKKDKNEQYVQGMEKFINTLRGKNYLAVFLAVPLLKQDIVMRKRGYEELFSALSPHSKLSFAYGENISVSVSKGISRSFTSSVNESVSNSNSNSESFSKGENSGSNFSGSINSNSEKGGSSFGWGSSYGKSSSYTSGTSFSHSISNSVGTSQANSDTLTDTDTSGSSETKTINFENKGVSNLMKRIDEQLERINQCESYGLWESCAYFFSDEISVSVLAAVTYKALMSGEKTGIENAHVNVWSSHTDKINAIMSYVKYLKHPVAKIIMPDSHIEQNVTAASLVSGSELPLLLGLPRKSVPGLAVQEMAEFGREVVYENKNPEHTISIGNIYHMGLEDKSTPVNMDLNLFSSHCFITGSSGSGKSYATYNLLDKLIKNNIKMLVVEPAKGEYKMIFGKLDKVNIFVTDVNTYRLLRINPFQFPDKIHVLSHIEQLMQIFGAAWSLTEAMPAILKDSVVKAYIKCGWDIRNSIWIKGISDHKYPVFQDVLNIMPEEIDTYEYSDEVKGNYKGALLTRIKSMTNGLNGLIFRKDEGIADSVLFDENTIIDLSEVGSEETIALIMGTLIMRLGEYRKFQRKAGLSSSHDNKLSHITVLEEAHNLLKRTSKEQSQDSANMTGKSVEMISNSIKEMRTYGEGFLIIDQSPLAVDSSVVENTATKIIMNTPSKEACEELGSAISLNENQTKELSRLNVGIAAIMQKGWMSPVLIKVGAVDASQYEADLQYGNISKMKYIRSCLAKELHSQIQEDKYDATALGKIIRSIDARINMPHLEPDRQKELAEIIELYKKFKTQSLRLSDKMLGILFIEIIGCDGLFDIMPKGVICTPQEFEYKEANEPEEQFEEFFIEMLSDVRKWINNFINALDNYISVEPEVMYTALRYMLAAKTDEGEDVTSKFGLIYRLIINYINNYK